jgi:hypothetical protein
MPTNTEITASLVAGTVPPDRNCFKDGQDVVNLVQDFVSVQSAASSGDGGSPNDSVAEQALNTANTALAAVQSLQSEQKETRSSGLMAIAAGDQPFTYSFTPPMPSTAYFIDVTYYAGSSPPPAISAFYNWRVLESSITVNGFTLLFDNTPVNTKIAVRVTQQ